MSIAFVVLKLEGGQIDPPTGVTGSRNSPGRTGLRPVSQLIFTPLNQNFPVSLLCLHI